MGYSKEIRIEFNQENMEEYNQYYKKMNPRTKKPRLDNPLCPMLNAWTAMIRQAQHAQKVKYGEYCRWLLEKSDVPKLQLEDCEIEYIATFPTRTRRDLDGLILNSKTYNDIYVEYGLLKDDSFYQVKSLRFSAQYEKSVKKIVAVIRY